MLLASRCYGGKPQLTDEEERTEVALSFAGVLQAWRHEYALRRGACGDPEFKPVQMRAPATGTGRMK